MDGVVGRCAVTVLDEDDQGIPRSLRLFAARVEAEACRHAAAASRSAGSDLVRAFRGSAIPAVPIRQFLEWVHLVVRRSGRSGDSTTPDTVCIDGTCFVLAALYLHRFLQSPAAREAGILVEPATAHRLAAVALFLGTKFGGHAPKKWTIVFELASGRVIRAAEMADLEERFLRAISFRLFVAYREYDWFSRVLVMDSRSSSGSCAATISNRQADAAGGEEKGAQAPRGSCTTSRSNRQVDVVDGEEKAPLAPLRLYSTSKKKADAAGGEEMGAQALRGSCTTSRSKRQVDVADGEEKATLAPLRLFSTSKKRQADAMVREEDRRRRVRPCLPLPAVISH